MNRRTIFRRLTAAGAAVVTLTMIAGSQTVIMPYPGDINSPVAKKYSVTVNGTPVIVREELCSSGPQRNSLKALRYCAMCGLSGNAVIEITCYFDPGAGFLSPKRLNIPLTINVDKVSFKIDGPGNFAFQTPEQTPLFLFITPVLDEVRYNPADPGVVYYGPGTHQVGSLRIESDRVYYLAPGAVLKGNLQIDSVRNVKIIGRGIIDNRWNTGHVLNARRSQNIYIEGVGFRNGLQGWQHNWVNCRNVEIAWVNLMSWAKNNDGIDLGSGCQNFLVRNNFIGAGDDCLGWHATNSANDGEEPVVDCIARDCLIWGETGGNGIRIGSSMETSYFKNITFSNIDMAHLAPRIQDGHVFKSDHSDWAKIYNLTLENIYNETSGRAIYIALKKTSWTNPKGYRPGLFEGIKIINFFSDGEEEFTLLGYDKEHGINDVYIRNVWIKGERINNLSDIKTNEFVTNVRIDNDNKD